MENERKGRNSFVDVRRKSLTFNNFFSDTENVNLEKPKQTIKSYYQSLLNEKQDWRDMLKEKKIALKNIERKHKVEITIKKKDVEKYITPEDKEFLDNKPKYIKILNSVRKCVDSFAYLDKHKLDLIDYYNKACNELEVNHKVLVDEMCSNDLCDICNIKNCHKEDHKFAV